MPVARLIADCAITESAASLCLRVSPLTTADLGPPLASPAGLNPPGHRALSQCEAVTPHSCTAVNRNPLRVSSQHRPLPLSLGLTLLSQAKPTLSVSSPSRGENDSPSRQEPRGALQGQFLWLPALPSSSHEETCLVAQSGQQAGRARGKSGGKFGGWSGWWDRQSDNGIHWGLISIR